MSVDQAFREMIREEIEVQLRPLRTAVSQLGDGGELDALRALAQTLSPLAGLLGVSPTNLPASKLESRRGPGRPRAAGRQGPNGSITVTHRPASEDAAPCAIIGCDRTSRTKGYCSAHYQKL